jgi:hypothetical protein
MRRQFLNRYTLGLGALIVGVLCVGSSEAQPPGKGKGPKGRPGPPIDAEFMTLRGTVQEITKAPKGEMDGLVLSDGKRIHWPPHMQNRFKELAVKGDRVRATGYWETGPRGDTKLEVSKLTNLDTNASAENPDRPPPAEGRPDGRPTPKIGEALRVSGPVKEFTSAPKGEVDGLVLRDGTWVHWPPHQQSRFKDVAAKGDRVEATGYWEVGKKGDTKLEVSTLTNLETNKSAENPERPQSGSARPISGKAEDRDDRLKSLENQLEQLQRELKRLRNER